MYDFIIKYPMQSLGILLIAVLFFTCVFQVCTRRDLEYFDDEMPEETEEEINNKLSLFAQKREDRP